MEVVGKEKLHSFTQKHADVQSQVTAWLHEAEEAVWKKPNDIKLRYPGASFLPDKVVVFNLKGKKYRLVVKVAYNTGTVLVTKIGTHAQYSKWKF